MIEFSRRNVIVSAAALTGVTLLMMKPGDKSGPRDAYFLGVQKALIAAGIAVPTMVVDKARLNINIDTLTGFLPPGMGYRIVAKSLPSLGLIEHIRKRTGTDLLMTFNLPMLLEISQAMPEANQLLGKPLPVVAAQRYFEQLPLEASGAAENIQWLVDTPERLAQYAMLAGNVGRDIAINLELDVGLHRGGMVPGAALGDMLNTIRKDPRLSFAGFMGYDPHIAALPTAMGWRERAIAGVGKTYSAALSQAGEVFGADWMAGITRNAAGSPTYRNYQDTEIANEVSVGSCLVKPTHFDTQLLEPHVPASFIATPVIKSLPVTQMPGLEFADGATRAWNPNASKTVFIYGGNWLADPVDPPGLAYNKTFGRSSNQEMLNGGQELEISPDEFVFLRPHQSEAVFLQFGDIAVYEDGAITQRWPVFDYSA